MTYISEEKKNVRFWKHIQIDNASGCWIWNGTIRNGYGRVHYKKGFKTAHRVVYEKLIGTIPEGMTLDHLCRNRSCVKPNHLEVTDMRTNVLRGFGATAINARKTKCKRGHLLRGKNVYWLPNGGGRACRKCRIIVRHSHPELKHKWDMDWKIRVNNRCPNCNKLIKPSSKICRDCYMNTLRNMDLTI